MIGSHEFHHDNTFFRNRIMGGRLAGLGVQPNNYAIGNELTKHKHPSYGLNNTMNARPGSITHGNYVADGAGIQWDPSIQDHIIPESYYLTERPDWFGDLDWPCYGGDLMEETSGNNNNRSPSEVRYWTMMFPEISPSNLQVSDNNGNADLSWYSNSTGIVDFIICRSFNGEDYYRIGETFDTVFTDIATASGQYHYYVRARNHLGGVSGDDWGGESDPSNIVSIIF